MSKEEGNGGMRRGERGKGLPAKFATLLYTDIDVHYFKLPMYFHGTAVVLPIPWYCHSATVLKHCCCGTDATVK